MRVVLFGSPEFAVPSLHALKKEPSVELVSVVTQPDKPVGRKMVMTPPPVKVAAIELGVPVFQSDRINSEESLDILRGFDADLFVTAAYGQILRQPLLDIPKLGVVNVHASLLPKYRGASPIAWSIKCGEKTTGVTTMFTDIGVDTGDILLQRELPIESDDTTGTLTEKLADMGAEVLIATIWRMERGSIERYPQDPALATKTPLLKKTHGMIDFSASFDEIDRLVRAMDPWPGTWTTLFGKKLAVYHVEKVPSDDDLPSGTGLGGLIVKCSGGAVRLSDVRLEGSKRMSDEDLIRGRRVEKGESFGSIGKKE